MRYGDIIVDKTGVIGQVREVRPNDVRVMVTHGDGITTDEQTWPRENVRAATYIEKVNERSRISNAERASRKVLEAQSRDALAKLTTVDVVAVCRDAVARGRFPSRSQLEDALARRADVKRNYMPQTGNPLPKLVEKAVTEGVLIKLKGTELRAAFHRGHAPKPRLAGNDGHWHYVPSGELEQLIKIAAGEEGVRLDRVLHAERQLDAAAKLAGWTPEPDARITMGHVDGEGLNVTMPTSVLDALLARASAPAVTPPE